MTRDLAKTNGDYIAPAVTALKEHVAALARHARQHPDEAAVFALPLAVLIVATARHKLSLLEQLLVTEVGYQAGVFAVKQYQQWKDQPAITPGPHLRKVN